MCTERPERALQRSVSLDEERAVEVVFPLQNTSKLKPLLHVWFPISQYCPTYIRIPGCLCLAVSSQSRPRLASHHALRAHPATASVAVLNSQSHGQPLGMDCKGHRQQHFEWPPGIGCFGGSRSYIAGIELPTLYFTYYHIRPGLLILGKASKSAIKLSRSIKSA